MSILLAIESSTDVASVALHVDGVAGTGSRACFRASEGVQCHSHTILPMVQAVLGEAGLVLRDCDAIAFGAGPGSFTGVRTACAIAQGLAFGSDRPVIGVDTLAATAQACRDATGSDDVLVMLDARMGEVYWGQYRWLDGQNGPGWTAVTAARLDAPARIGALVAGRPVACGNGFAAYGTHFDGCDFAATARVDIMPHAIQVAFLARRLLAGGAAVAARGAQPLYLRNDVALTTAERESRRLEVSA